MEGGVTMKTLTPAHTTWAQISVGVKMRLGVRKPAYADDGRTLVMDVGPARRGFRVFVTINGHDLYDIALQKNGSTVWGVFDIYAEQLGGTLVRMESENWG